jgi:hypothetical protein
MAEVLLTIKRPHELTLLPTGEAIAEVYDQLISTLTDAGLTDLLGTARKVATHLVTCGVRSGETFTMKIGVFTEDKRDFVHLVVFSSNPTISQQQRSGLPLLTARSKRIHHWSAGNTREGGTYISVVIGPWAKS